MSGPQLQKRSWKKPKNLPLHEHYVTPLSFHIEAVEKSKQFLGSCYTDKKFGMNKEAYLRQCYMDIFTAIEKQLDQSIADKEPGTLAIVRGSSGIGKSTFLAFLLATYSPVFKNIAVVYAPKASKDRGGETHLPGLTCVIWLQDEAEETKEEEAFSHDSEDRTECSVDERLRNALPNLDLIILDGCTIPFDFHQYNGPVIVAASPSMYVKNLEDQFPTSNIHYTMPPLEDEEAMAMAKIVGVDDKIVEDNLLHMNGIARYLFKPGAAKTKVRGAASSVSASSIMKLVSMQGSNKMEEVFATHSLVLWKLDGGDYLANPKYELVSRYAEQLVAAKLAKEKMEDLRDAMKSLQPLSGAEGYAGALFEAYAIRTLQEGCKLKLRPLEGGRRKKAVEILIPKLKGDPVTVEGNKLSPTLESYDSVRVPDTGKNGKFSPCLLWPTTTNFATFDCFYFHSDGKVYPLQMTISLDHVLKNSGAKNAKDYLDGMYGKGKKGKKGKAKKGANKYPAVFVVPREKEPRFEKQNFTGNVEGSKLDMGPSFEQWVAGI